MWEKPLFIIHVEVSTAFEYSFQLRMEGKQRSLMIYLVLFLVARSSLKQCSMEKLHTYLKGNLPTMYLYVHLT